METPKFVKVKLHESYAFEYTVEHGRTHTKLVYQSMTALDTEGRVWRSIEYDDGWTKWKLMNRFEGIN